MTEPEFSEYLTPRLELAEGKFIRLRRYEIFPCSIHSQTTGFIHIHHEEPDGTYHGYRKITVCSACKKIE